MGGTYILPSEAPLSTYPWQPRKCITLSTEIIAEAVRIHRQTVVLKAMPIGNLTGISEEERALIDAGHHGRVREE